MFGGLAVDNKHSRSSDAERATRPRARKAARERRQASKQPPSDAISQCKKLVSEAPSALLVSMKLSPDI